jgi:hypothetical protein
MEYRWVYSVQQVQPAQLIAWSIDLVNPWLRRQTVTASALTVQTNAADWMDPSAKTTTTDAGVKEGA